MRKKAMVASVWIAVPLVVFALLGTGCGESKTTRGSTAQVTAIDDAMRGTAGGAGSVLDGVAVSGGVVGLPDCSGSTAEYRQEWLDQLVKLAQNTMLRGERLAVDCIDGAPLATTTFPIDEDGGEVPAAYD